MKNLAGDPTCDIQIIKELEEAGIKTVVHPKPLKQEVPASITGKLGKLTFARAWYYWAVSGEVPLAVAEILYADPVGKKDIRVNGDCGCPAPLQCAEWRNPVTHRQILNMGQRAELEEYGKSESEALKKISTTGLQSYDFAEDPSTAGEGFIILYHIDSQAGLNLFVKVLRDHNLV